MGGAEGTSDRLLGPCVSRFGCVGGGEKAWFGCSVNGPVLVMSAGSDVISVTSARLGLVYGACGGCGVQISLTAEALELAQDRGGTMALDFIPPLA